jgi:hypothetical protein
MCLKELLNPGIKTWLKITGQGILVEDHWTRHLVSITETFEQPIFNPYSFEASPKTIKKPQILSSSHQNYKVKGQGKSK